MAHTGATAVTAAASAALLVTPATGPLPVVQAEAPPVTVAVHATVPVDSPPTVQLHLTPRPAVKVNGGPVKAVSRPLERPARPVPATPVVKATPAAPEAPTAIVAASASAAVNLAAAQAGKPYVYGAAGPSSFDCSGLVQYVFRQLGISLPRTAQAQYDVSTHIPAAEAAPGDLIFFGAPYGVYHEGIYAGNGKMWVAPHTGDVVKLQTIWSTYSVGRITV